MPSTAPTPDVGYARLSPRGGSGLRIGLIADTHIPEARPQLWPQAFAAFAGCDAILHGGDIHELALLDLLARIAPVFAARGNGDEGHGGRLRQAPDPRVRDTWILESAGDGAVVRIGLIHDLTIPEHPPHLTVPNVSRRRFGADPDAGQGLDVIVYGDTHVERIDQIGETLCINPGSPTYPRNLDTRLGTIGFLDIDDGRTRASICQLTEAGYEMVASASRATMRERPPRDG